MNYLFITSNVKRFNKIGVGDTWDYIVLYSYNGINKTLYCLVKIRFFMVFVYIKLGKYNIIRTIFIYNVYGLSVQVRLGS